MYGGKGDGPYSSYSYLYSLGFPELLISLLKVGTPAQDGGCPRPGRLDEAAARANVTETLRMG